MNESLCRKHRAVILIYPPVVKPSEPPPGIARLFGALSQRGIRCRVLDANIEGLLSLMEDSPLSVSDRWTVRAFRNRSANLASLRHLSGYRNFDRYERSVMDLNRVLQMFSPRGAWRLSLGNCQHNELSPVRSNDLLQASEHPEENPFYTYFKKRFLEIVEAEQPSLVGFSLNFLSQALCTFAMLGFLKRECPGIRLVLGGGLVTSWMRRPGWRNPFEGLVDDMVAGPGESALLSIMGIGGPGEEHCAPSFDALPMKDYLAHGPILPYSSSSGCYWNGCAFCPEKAERNPYIPVPVQSVMGDLDVLVKKTEFVLIHLLDNAISPALMKALIEKPLGVPWYGFARFTRHFGNQDFCRALKRSGCVMLKLGLESGDQSVLDQECKGVDLELASLALKNIEEAGIATYIYLLFGTPAETIEAARRTLDYTVRHAEGIDFLNLAIFNMPVYGPEAQEFETKTLYEGDLSLYTGFSHPKGWNRGVVRQFIDKEFKRHPAVAKILRRDPPLFTSNHAPFFVMEEDGRRKG